MDQQQIDSRVKHPRGTKFCGIECQTTLDYYEMAAKAVDVLHPQASKSTCASSA